MSETEHAKPTGFTREMREAKAAGQPAETASITRESRKPFGSVSQKLARPKREGYYRHWFNDAPGRIDQALEAGYTHVQDRRTGKNEQQVVGTRDGGHPIIAFLMEIPQEWRDEDMAAYERKNTETDESIRRGEDAKIDPNERSKYYPTAQGRRISITRSATPR